MVELENIALEDKLGDEEGFTKVKGIQLVVYLGMIGFLFYAAIGSPVNVQVVIYFYMAMLLVSIIFFVINWLLPQKTDFLDSITVEGNSPFSPKTNLIIGIIMAVVLAGYILTTGQAFVKAAPFGITINSLNFVGGNAIESAIFGAIETIFFFSLIFPVLYSTINKFADSIGIAIVGSVLAISTIFFLFHTYVYAYDVSSLTAVFVFGLVFQALPTLFFRNSTESTLLHFTNNLVVTLRVITKFALQIFV